MTAFTIKIDDAQLRTALAAVADRLGNLTKTMDAIGGRLRARAQGSFLDEQAPDGTPWKPLAASTILQRQKGKHWPGPILRVSGNLFESLDYKAGPTSVVIGAGRRESEAYAAIHQFGGQAGRGHKVTIPARPFLPSSGILPDAWLESCIDVINQQLAEVIKK